MRMRTSASTFLVCGLGGRILVNNYVSAPTPTSLTGFFVGALVFWIAERFPTSEVALSIAGILGLRMFVDSLTSQDAGLIFWTLLGFFFSGVCTVASAALLRKHKESWPWRLWIPRSTRSLLNETPDSATDSDSPPSYESLTHPVQDLPRYRWQSPALSRMLDEVLQVMDNVNQSFQAPPPPPPPPPAVIANNSSSSSTYAPPRPTCAACGDPVPHPVISIGCKHTYDINCIIDMFLANLSSSVFPPICCKRGVPIPLALIEPHISADVLEMMRAKQRELATPDRLYCSNPKCSQFLGSRQRDDTTNPTSPPKSNKDSDNINITCSACTTQTCARCGTPAHRGGTKRCTVDKALKKALLLGQSRGWQRCPQCRAVVERSSGCRHISCTCGAHFCYGCGFVMSACGCARKDKRKDYLLRAELASADTKDAKTPGAKGAAGSVFVSMCKKSWGGVKGVISVRKAKA